LSMPFPHLPVVFHHHTVTDLFRVNSLGNPHNVDVLVLSKLGQFACETAIILTTAIAPNEHLGLISISQLMRELQPNEYAK